MKKIYYGILYILVISCQSNQLHNTPIQLSENDFLSTIDYYSDDAKEYDGLQNTLEISGTILNSKVLQTQTQRQATILNWEKNQYESELKNKNSGILNKTDFFVSFFTPDRKNADLTRSETLWKIILVTNKRRIEGKATKLTLLNSEIQSLYPQHNRWSNAYLISFQIPLKEVENTESELIITGPLANQSLHFKALKTEY